VGPITSLASPQWTPPCGSPRQGTGQPLWLLAGGAQRHVPLYDTEGAGCNCPPKNLLKEPGGPKPGLARCKIKVGKPDPSEDLERLQAVREAVGPRMHLMVDANQSMTYAEATARTSV